MRVASMKSKRSDVFSIWFGKAASKSAAWVGSPWSFIAALATVVLWGALGPRYHYSDTWQLVINTGTTIVTFLIVFLIQNTQNRDAKAIHLKLDELIKGVKGARTSMVNLEQLSDKDLERLQKEFERLHERTNQREVETEMEE